MQGSVQAGAAMTNQYKFTIAGMPDLYLPRIGEISAEAVFAEMADRTMQATGEVKGGEFEVDMYPHHADERVAFELWSVQCATGSPLAKREGQLAYLGADGAPVFVVLLTGLLCKGPKYPELSKGGDGEGVKVTYPLTYDTVISL